jgi:hypothetical protein
MKYNFKVSTVKEKMKQDLYVFLPGLANTRMRSRLGFLEATAKARAPPRESPSRYIGFIGALQLSICTISSTILISPAENMIQRGSIFS